MLKKFFYYLILTVIALISIGPFLWLVFSSLTPESYILGKSQEAVSLTLSNYRGFIDYINFPLTFRNTLIISAGSILIDVIFSSLCAYPLAFMDFPGKTLIMYLLLGTMIFPAAAGMVINYMTISRMHLMDTILGVILPTSVHPFSVLILRQSFRLVSKDSIDAARVDGASDSLVLFHVLIPAIGPGIATVALFDFISSWNAFLWPLIVLRTRTSIRWRPCSGISTEPLEKNPAILKREP